MPTTLTLVIFIGIFAISFFLRYLASNHLLEEFSEERSNVMFFTKGNWSVNSKMFNEKGKMLYIASNIIPVLWIVYIIIIAIN